MRTKLKTALGNRGREKKNDSCFDLKVVTTYAFYVNRPLAKPEACLPLGPQDPRPEKPIAFLRLRAQQLNVERRRERRNGEQDLLFRKVATWAHVLAAAVGKEDAVKAFGGEDRLRRHRIGVWRRGTLGWW